MGAKYTVSGLRELRGSSEMWAWQEQLKPGWSHSQAYSNKSVQKHITTQLRVICDHCNRRQDTEVKVKYLKKNVFYWCSEKQLKIFALFIIFIELHGFYISHHCITEASFSILMWTNHEHNGSGYTMASFTSISLITLNITTNMLFL